MPDGVIEVSPDIGTEGEGACPTTKGNFLCEGKRSMLVHHHERWDPREVNK